MLFLNINHSLNLGLGTKDKSSIADNHCSTCYGEHATILTRCAGVNDRNECIYNSENDRNEFRMYIDHNTCNMKTNSMKAIETISFNITHLSNLGVGTKDKSSIVENLCSTCYGDHTTILKSYNKKDRNEFRIFAHHNNIKSNSTEAIETISFNITHLLHLGANTENKNLIVNIHGSTCYDHHMRVKSFSMKDRNEFRMSVHHNNMKSDLLKAIDTVSFNITILSNLGMGTKYKNSNVNGHRSAFYDGNTCTTLFTNDHLLNLVMGTKDKNVVVCDHRSTFCDCHVAIERTVEMFGSSIGEPSVAALLVGIVLGECPLVNPRKISSNVPCCCCGTKCYDY